MKDIEKEIELVRLAILDTINHSEVRTNVALAAMTELTMDFWMATTGSNKSEALDGLSRCVNTLILRKYP